MSSIRPLLLFAFANDRLGDEATYLRNLPEERRALERVFPVGEPRPYDVHIDYNVTPDGLRALLDRYTDRIVGLHFGGHATEAGLGLETADGRPDVLRVAGFAGELAGLPKLAFVFLNGCSTAEHVEAIRAACGDHGPAIVATEWAILDAAATRFAGRFYRNLRLGRSLAEAFRKAEAQQRGDIATPSAARAGALVELRPEAVGCLELSYRLLRPAATHRDGPDWPWALCPSPGDAGSVDWRLPTDEKAIPWALVAILVAVVGIGLAWAMSGSGSLPAMPDARVADIQPMPTEARAPVPDAGRRDGPTAPVRPDAAMTPDGARADAASAAPRDAASPDTPEADPAKPTRRPTTARRGRPKPTATPPESPPAARVPDTGPTPGSMQYLENLLPDMGP